MLSGFLVGDYDGLGGFVAGVMPPVGLHEHGIDLFEVDGFGVVSHGFDEGADAEVFDGAQGAFGTNGPRPSLRRLPRSASVAINPALVEAAASSRSAAARDFSPPGIPAMRAG
jgi:hypothetical protein